MASRFLAEFELASGAVTGPNECDTPLPKDCGYLPTIRHDKVAIRCRTECNTGFSREFPCSRCELQTAPRIYKASHSGQATE